MFDISLVAKRLDHRHGYILLFGLIAVILCAWSCAPQTTGSRDFIFKQAAGSWRLAGNWRFHFGDDPAYASAAFVDSSWQLLAVPDTWSQRNLPSAGIAWYRSRIAINDTAAMEAAGLFFEHVHVAMEVYWNGELIGSNGKVATRADKEIAGDDAFLCQIPAEKIANATHLLALRVSNHHAVSGGISLPPKIGGYNKLADYQNAHHYFYGFLFGIFFISGLYHLALYWGGRTRREYLLFALLSFGFAIFVFLDPISDLFHANQHFFKLRFQALWIDTLLLVALAYGFMVAQFDYPHRWLMRLVVAATALLIPAVFYRENIFDMGFEWQARNWWIQSTALGSVYLSFWALKQRRPGSLLLIFGTLILGAGGFLSAHRDSSLIAFFAFAIFVFAMSVTLSKKMSALENEIKKMMQVFRLFVPDQVLARLAKNGIDSIRLGSVEDGHASILFSDIRAFATVAETLTPSETLGYLNAVMQRLAPIVQAHNGFVNQYVGDAIMAIFYTPTHTRDAVNSAIAMRHALQQYNLEREQRGEERIEIGIGINSGRVIMGTIGSPTRMESAVIGDAVNLASRIEQLTKRYRVGILIAENNYLELPDREKYCSREVDVVQVKGKNNVVTLYEIFDADPPPLKQKKIASLADYYQGVLYYRAMEWEKAVEAFSRCLKIYPRDPVAELYVERCILYQRQPPPPEWNGVTVLTAKE
jgi:class 3 adenylate cyclase